MTTAPPRQAGFTIFELMLVVALAAVILGLGVPNFRQFMLNSRMTSAANDMLAALHTARSEAINRHQPVVMCFSTNPADAVPACAGDGTAGWVVWVDDRDPAVAEGNDGNGVPDADEPVILRHDAMPDSVRTRSTPNGNEGYVAFNGAGFSRQIAAVGERFDGVVMCDYRGNVGVSGGDLSAARGLIVSATGRPRVTRSVNEITTSSSLGACP
jgi:type IV fimbrial biogenesis protein FimT